ncbi:hypothetical protein Celaphus_00007692 [Cervus elaphus hippelaphus]|uniref:Uncharacterized protein n=1 Tax=Cervus elaphus hippelaphus TaxID=46360 RepID=A0A212CBE7_CEREH|nr:hypothetical protein Celaphus_00007692 [Cervus elaphus hippelaphus]
MPRSPALTRIARARPQRAAPNVRPSIGPEGAGRDVRLRLAAPQAPPREGAWRFGLEQLKPLGAAAGCLRERWRGADGRHPAPRPATLTVGRGVGGGADPWTQQERFLQYVEAVMLWETGILKKLWLFFQRMKQVKACYGKQPLYSVEEYQFSTAISKGAF